MRVLRVLLVLMIFAVAGTYWYGSRLPVEHTAASTIVLVAPADTVFKTIRNVGTTPEWWSDMASARKLPDRPKETWEENMGAAGILKVEITKVVAGRRIVQTILDEEDQGWGGTWTIEVADTRTGTEVTITEEGYVESPFFRIVMKWMGPHRTIDSYLRSLGGHFGEMVTPRRV